MTGSASGATFGPEWSAGFRRGSDAELRGWAEEALAWCDAADEIAMRHFRRDLEVTRKPDTTFVTQADTGVERLLRERIAEAHPDHGVLGEESGTDAAGASTRWIIDPIDGTHNYLRGVPLFATLIAVERDGELQASVISAPALGMRWHAWRGGGAWVRGGSWGATPQRIHVSGISTIEEAQVLYASTNELDSYGRAPGLAHAARPRLARARLRRLLGLHLGRRVGCGDHGRVGPVAVGRGGAVRADRGGRRACHGLRRQPVGRQPDLPRDERSTARRGPRILSARTEGETT